MPPLLPAIHRSLPLNEKAIGAVSSLPILLLATATLLGSLLIARVGARRALVAGLLVLALAGALRGVGPSVAVLFTMTLLMGVGIAISQPTLPSLVALWTPSRVAAGTGFFSNGFLIGEILPAALTVPFIVSLVGGWEPALAFWSLPVLATAAGVLLLTPHEPRAAGAPRPLWIPDWREPTTWRLGLCLGSASAVYFGLNAFIPDYMRSTHHPELITVSLTFLNIFQLPASFVVGALSHHVLGRRWPFVATGVLTLVAIVAFALLPPGIGSAIAIGIVGYASAQAFMLTLAMPPLLAPAGDVHRLTVGITSIQYTTAFIAPVLAGAIWDATGSNAVAYLMVIVAGVVQTVVPIGLRLPAAMRGRQPAPG